MKCSIHLPFVRPDGVSSLCLPLVAAVAPQLPCHRVEQPLVQPRHPRLLHPHRRPSPFLFSGAAPVHGVALPSVLFVHGVVHGALHAGTGAEGAHQTEGDGAAHADKAVKVVRYLVEEA